MEANSYQICNLLLQHDIMKQRHIIRESIIMDTIYFSYSVHGKHPINWVGCLDWPDYHKIELNCLEMLWKHKNHATIIFRNGFLLLDLKWLSHEVIVTNRCIYTYNKSNLLHHGHLSKCKYCIIDMITQMHLHYFKLITITHQVLH